MYLATKHAAVNPALANQILARGDEAMASKVKVGAAPALSYRLFCNYTGRPSFLCLKFTCLYPHNRPMLASLDLSKHQHFCFPLGIVYEA